MYGGELWRKSFLMTVIQSDLGGEQRRSEGGEIGGRAHGGAITVVVRGDDGRTSLFFYETFISSYVYISKPETLTWKFGLQFLQYAQGLPTRPHPAALHGSPMGAEPITDGSASFGCQLAFSGCQVRVAGLKR